MGLFNRKKKEPEYVVSEQRIQDILNNGIEVEVGMGVHGADEIIAGAMIGNTGKLIAMGNYGKIKYQPTILYFYDDYIMFQLTGQQFSYGDMYRWEKRNVGFIHTEFALITVDGEIPLKATHPNFLAIIKILERVSQEYVERVNEEKSVKKQEQDQVSVDRLIRLGELHERGLLSDEEFEAAKQKLI